MRSRLDVPTLSPWPPLSPTLPSGSDVSGRVGFLSAFSDTLRRARTWRPGSLTSGGGGNAAAMEPMAATDVAESASGAGNGGGGGGAARAAGWRLRGLDIATGLRSLSPVLRNKAPGLVEGGSISRSRGSTPGRDQGASRKPGRLHHAVPVPTTRVQDGIKWVNLVRFINLANLLRPCLRPRNRRRVRFAAHSTQRRLVMGPSGGESGKPCCDLTAAAAAGTVPGSTRPPASRPVYIQVKQGRHLVWPSFEGVDYSCFCVLLVGGQQRGTTQAVPVAQGGGGGGGGGGGVGWGGGSSNTVQWNEVFSMPRSCFEGTPDGRVMFEVWSTEPDDVLVGQAELLLGPMLDAEHPHPLTTVLQLQTIDEETGQVEPGSCGELHVAAWVEPEVTDKAAQHHYSLPSSVPADLDEAGVVTSNLSAPCGSKSMPQVVHSPLGTLYEEPCVVGFKISIVGLVDLIYDRLLSGASQSATSKKRVRLEGLRSAPSSRDQQDAQDRGRRSTKQTFESAVSGLPTAALGAAASSTPPPSTVTSPSTATRGMGLYLERLRRRRQRQRFPRQLRKPRAASPDGKVAGNGAGGGGGAAAICCGGCGNGVCLPRFLKGSSQQRTRRQSGGGSGVASAVSGTVDDLMEEEEDATSHAVLGGDGGGGAGVGDGKAPSGDDGDDGSSLLLHPTLPLSGMTSEEQSAGAGQGQGQGVFCYFKVSVDKQSAKSRLRWVPAPPPPVPSPGLTISQQLQLQRDTAASVTLQPSVFVFTLVRPLGNVPVGLAMYVTTSARRRGRVVGRLTVQLYDLLDRVLGTTTAGGVPACERPDVGVNGKKVEVVQQFEEVELGAVRLIVQMADLDNRAMLFRLPLVSDPQQLMAEGAPLGPSAIPRCAFLAGGGTLPFGMESGVAASVGDGVGEGKGGLARHKLGPVLSDKELLLNVLRRSDVDPDVEDMFVGSYSRIGSLKTASEAAVQARANSSRPSGFGGGISRGLAHGGRLDPIRVVNEALAAATAPGDAPGSVSATFLRSHDGLSLPDVMSTLERSPGGSLAGRAEGDGDGCGGGAAVASGGGGVGGGARAPPPAAGGGGGCALGAVLGSLVLRIAAIDASGALDGSSCCCIVKCGPHWLRTMHWDLAQGVGRMPQWQVVIPLYNPATILTAGIFTSSAKSVMGLTFSDNLALISRVRLKLSSVRPFRRSWHIVAMYMNNGGSPAANPGRAPLVAALGLKLQYGSISALALSYLMPTAPESLYELQLEAHKALKMETDARKISENWLASAQPPIPPEVTKLLLDDGRVAFNFTRTKNNWRRVKSGVRLLMNLNGWFKHICSWKSLRDSAEVVFCIALLCYLPSTACKLFFFMTALRGVKGFILFRRRVAALVDSGAEAAAALLVSPRSAAAAAAAAATGADPGGGGGRGSGSSSEAALGMLLDVMISSGGVVDADSDDEAGEDRKVPVGTVAEFKRKVAELVELGLLLQNLFDDVASILERMQAVLSFQDVMASCLFILACALLMGVVELLGFPTTGFLLLLWQVRPPSLRDALPPPPFCYFMKLPCKSAAEFG